MITYREYMDDSSNLHRAFYLEVAQACYLELSAGMMDKVRASEDEHLNDVPLKLWDDLAGSYKERIGQELKRRGTTYSLSSGVSAFKALAYYLRDGGAPFNRSVAAFIVKNGLHMATQRIATREGGETEWMKTARHWRIQLYNQTTTIYCEYSMGAGNTGEPDICDVVDSLRSDSSVANLQTFEKWADEFGYDSDSRKAEKLYFACKRIADDMLRLLGANAFLELINEVEGL